MYIFLKKTIQVPTLFVREEDLVKKVEAVEKAMAKRRRSAKRAATRGKLDEDEAEELERWTTFMGWFRAQGPNGQQVRSRMKDFIREMDIRPTG